MRTFFTVLTIAFSVATLITATANIEGTNMQPAAQWFFTGAIISLFAAIIIGYNRPSRYITAKPTHVAKDLARMPSPQEIEDTIRRVRAFINDERGTAAGLQPQPPNGAIVECEECHVKEVYPRGNDAAQSAHLNEHPTRCKVTA